MRYSQLRAFHQVAVCGGFSAAAKALHISQPVVSDHVRKLEADYDIRLFNRQRKPVELTPKGQILLEITQRFFDVESQIDDFLTESKKEQTGTLRIIADSVNHITPLLSLFREKYPNVFITISSGNSQTVIEQLHRFNADLGVTGNVPVSSDFHTLNLGVSSVVAFVNAQSEYANHHQVSIKTLATWPLIVREQGSITRFQLLDYANSAGVSLNIKMQVEGREAIRQLVATGAGVGIVSEAEYEPHPCLRKIVISDLAPEMRESILCLGIRRQNRLIHAFMDIAKDHLPE